MRFATLSGDKVKLVMLSVVVTLMARPANATITVDSAVLRIAAETDSLSESSITDTDLPIEFIRSIISVPANSTLYGAESSQRSFITDLGMSGSGTAGAFVDSDEEEGSADASSSFSVFFSIPDPHDFALSGYVEAAAAHDADFAFMRFESVSSSSLIDSASATDRRTDFALEGSLPAGQYQLFLEAIVSASTATTGQAGFDFGLVLSQTPASVIPEPTSVVVWLCLASVIGLVGTCRRGSRGR